MNLPQDIIAARVGTERVDDGERLLRYSLGLIGLISVVRCLVFLDGEVDPALSSLTICFSYPEIVGKVIERTAKILNNITSDKRKLYRHIRNLAEVIN